MASRADVGVEPDTPRKHRTPSGTPPASGRVFLSYRREDTSGYAGRLHDALTGHFGDERIFRDVDAIEPGADFVQVIEESVRSCGVLVAVIGREWLRCIGADGRRRLDDSEDFVRLEIQTALKRNIPVIPVLVENAPMPAPGDLPASLRELSRRHALAVSDDRWDHDVSRLIARLENIVGPPAAEAPPPPPTWKRTYRRVRASRTLSAIVTVTTVAATGLGLYWGIVPFFQSEAGPPPMSSDFNLAVAPFTAVDGAGHPVESSEAVGMARDFYTELSKKLEAIEQEIEFTLDLRGPDDVDAPKGSTSEERAEAASTIAEKTRADLVIYGIVRIGGDFTPELFVSQSRFATAADDFLGHHQLGSGIPLNGDIENPATRLTVRTALLPRTQALAEFVLGLGHAAREEWRLALTQFERAERTQGWPETDGKEVLFLFLGNASLKLDQLERAQGFYDYALELNREYSRARLGLAEVRYHQSRGTCEAETVDTTGLTESLGEFDRAGSARVQPALADVPAKVAYGKGRVYLCLSQAEVGAHWGDAERAFRQVVAIHDSADERTRKRLARMTAESRADLGFLSLPAAGDPDGDARLRRAATEYELAVTLYPEPDPDGRKAYFSSMLGFIYGRLGDIAEAQRFYRNAIELTEDPEAGARYRAELERLTPP